MSATANKGLALPVTGSPNWDVPLNNNEGIIDVALAGVQNINLAAYAGTVLLTDTYPIVSTPLTSMSYVPIILVLFGAVAGDVTIQWPAGITGQWTVVNYTSGSGNVYVEQLGGSGLLLPIAQNAVEIVAASGNNMVAVSGLPSASVIASIGDVKTTAASAIPAKWYLCDGAAMSTTTYAALFAAIGYTYGGSGGTFNLPNCNGRALVGFDNMGGTPAGVLPGLNASAPVQGAATHTLVAAELPVSAYADGGHSHGVTDPQHSHAVTVFSYSLHAQTGTSTAVAWNPVGGATGSAYTDISIVTGNAAISNAGGGGAHSIVQPSIGFNVIIYAGV